jgi:hypothetical protein
MIADLLLCIAFSAALGIPMLLIAFVAARLTNNRFRFSLRTLLIVTTLVAVGLGLIVWLGKAIVQYGQIRHQRSVTQSLADWAQEYSEISSDDDAASAAGVIEYVQTYYVVGGGYSSTPEENAALESQRKKTIQTLSNALETYFGRNPGTRLKTLKAKFSR